MAGALSSGTVLAWAFGAGALLCNGLPHTLAAVQGRPFPTPFAQPPGRGDSSPMVNAAWGVANLAAALAVLRARPPAAPAAAVAFGSGFGLAALGLAWHFGRVRSGR